MRDGAALALSVFSANAFWSTAASQSRPTLERRDLERFADSAFQRYVRGSVTPSLAAVVVRGDSVLLAKGYGLETEQGTPVSADSTVFHVASLSKLFVATAVMQLVDAGRVHLDDPVANYLSGLAVPRTITLRQLVTHTSGLDSPFMQGVVPNADELYPLDTFFARFAPTSGRPPSREIRYSNLGMSLAALVVERVVREPFDMYVANHIFRPLGMRSSTFSQPPPPELDRRVATAGAGRVPDALVLYPSGSLMSTASDMSRFMSALFGGEGAPRLMSDSALRMMESRQWSANPSAPGVAIGFFESDIGGQRALFHTGARTHFSLMYLLPMHRVGIYVVHSMRQGGPFQSLRLDFVRAFVNRYFPDSADRPARSPTARPNTRARRFAGTYRPVLLSATTIERAAWLGLDTRVKANDDGTLSVSIPGGPRLRAVEVKPAVYRTVEGHEADLTIAFSDTVGGPSTRMSSSGATQDPLTFDRLRWYTLGTFHAIVLALAYVVIASFLGVLAIVAVRRIRHRHNAPASPNSNASPIRRFAVGASTSALAAPISFAGLLFLGSSDADAGSGLRRALTVATTLLLVASLLALGLLLLTAVSRRTHHLSKGWRLYYVLIGIAGAVFAPLLAYYHLLGPWWI